MKNKTTKNLFLWALVLACFSILNASCEKVDVPKDTPRCIKNKIRDMSDNCIDEILEYDYKGKTVYYFAAKNCPDYYSSLYDEDCNLVCIPDGGLTGRGDGKCEGFSTTATNKRQIWKK